MMFKDELDNRLLYINSVIKEFLPESDNELYKKIIDAACYSVEAGGKRIRPMIMLETYRLCGGKDEEIVKPFMAALEYIHTYSLVHDDLPAMDNDDYRRGRLTTHKVFGEDFGILAGDALLNYAYEVMTSAVCAASPENMKNCAGAAAVIARKAGIFGMVGGQSLDVLLTDKPVNEKEMEFIFNLKTGALIEAAFMAGVQYLQEPVRSVSASLKRQEILLVWRSRLRTISSMSQVHRKFLGSRYSVMKRIIRQHM